MATGDRSRPDDSCVRSGLHGLYFERTVPSILVSQVLVSQASKEGRALRPVPARRTTPQPSRSGRPASAMPSRRSAAAGPPRAASRRRSSPSSSLRDRPSGQRTGDATVTELSHDVSTMRSRPTPLSRDFRSLSNSAWATALAGITGGERRGPLLHRGYVTCHRARRQAWESYRPRRHGLRRLLGNRGRIMSAERRCRCEPRAARNCRKTCHRLPRSDDSRRQHAARDHRDRAHASQSVPNSGSR